ncbi:hypothetical protein D8674_009055 [Pyrus ussuriensis x Pyrus communis]|uniref:Protein BIC1-like n=1 Tax=Pyrus ussuriensis x Pyrus communis TaxID=2448454 RepID=A0A5N5HUI1_9ROSA|nr:hypothetical protein D8674_009055 [Pyrus ussuriensis x Pyrus communis]
MRRKPSQISLQKPIIQNTPVLPNMQENGEQISKKNDSFMEQQGSTSPKMHEKDEELSTVDGQDSAAVEGDDDVVVDQVPTVAAAEEEESGLERLKKHRMEVAGQVWIPEIWGQEELLQDWIDCSAFDASLFPSGIMTARSALVEEGSRENSGRLRIENRC